MSFTEWHASIFQFIYLAAPNTWLCQYDSKPQRALWLSISDMQQFFFPFPPPTHDLWGQLNFVTDSETAGQLESVGWQQRHYKSRKPRGNFPELFHSQTSEGFHIYQGYSLSNGRPTRVWGGIQAQQGWVWKFRPVSRYKGQRRGWGFILGCQDRKGERNLE